MSVGTQTFRGRAELSPPTSPIIYNVPVTLANTETSQALTASTKMFLIRARNGSKIQLSFVSGDTGTLFLTIPKGCNYIQDAINFNGVLYFRTDKPDETVEIVEWV